MSQATVKCPNGCTEAPWGVEISEIYDGICYWTCLACGANWHRFPAEWTGRRAAVERVWAASRGDKAS